MKRVCTTRFWRQKCSLRKNKKGIFIFLAIASGVYILLLALNVCKSAYFSCQTEKKHSLKSNPFVLGKNVFNESILNKHYKLDFEGDDVLIYLHIQKTGGATFGRHLVRNLDVDFPCKCSAGIKRCQCLTKNKKRWLFSRHATGWMCGLHADWTELTDCVDDWFKHNDLKSRKHRIYHYITFLREPISRFLSEWRHVQRGATWRSSRLHCNGKDASLEELPFCFSGVNWLGVTLEEFLSCQHNLAFNRMTRMLANLSKVNCYNHTGFSDQQVGEILLQSAKENLLECSFFGIVEEQQKTQFLFEHTMGIEFIDNFRQKDETHASQVVVSEDIMQKVVHKNLLDIELYNFAKDLFLQRVQHVEKRMGYTVDEFFRRQQKAYNNEAASVITYENEEEEDNGEEEVGDIVNFNPRKTASLVRTVKLDNVV